MVAGRQDSPAAPIRFDNSYARLPEAFFARLDPVEVRSPRLVQFNANLARDLGLRLEGLSEERLAAVFSGNEIPDGAEPLAMAYAGHQFGGFSPQLGDGRAILLGEVVDANGARFDVQLKGSGQTPFSRNGDGRAALGPVLREYLVSEAMHALGIKTTRSLAAVTTGEPVMRETVLPGAILTRVASSHVRVGSFEYFASRGDSEAVRVLADYVIDRHEPELREDARPYLALLDRIADRQASLVAQWMGVGFVHGVMNTDNTSVAGETIDYGPCAFLDYYDAGACFSSIDRRGRYSFANQGPIAQWNLVRLAECLLDWLTEPTERADPERAVDLANEVIQRFATRYEAYYLDVMRAKLGLARTSDEDRGLVDGLLDAMQRSKADFTNTFRLLADASEDPEAHGRVRELFADPTDYDTWARAWQERCKAETRPAAERATAMRAVNPAYIPRNHLVEEALRAAVEAGDYGPFSRLHSVLARPFEVQDGHERYAVAGPDDQSCYRTFCGT